MRTVNSESNPAQQIAYSDVFNSADAAAIAAQKWHFLLAALAIN